MFDLMLGKIKKRIQSGLRHFGYEIHRIDGMNNADSQSVKETYMEREEYGASNLQTKLENMSQGLPFEFPDITNLNLAVASCVMNEKRIVEFGSGTGNFAKEVAKDPTRFIVASEFDTDTHKWCLKNIPVQSNVVFINGPVPMEMGLFDLSVSIEVVEHIKDFQSFLMDMCALAPRSIITTPNRRRSKQDFHAGPPNYFKHVREWTAGEFYWVLRCFWEEVILYGLTSQSEPTFVKVNVDTILSPLIAICSSPLDGPFGSKHR